MPDFSKTALTGYRRDNGRVGIRNHVLIISMGAFNLDKTSTSLFEP